MWTEVLRPSGVEVALLLSEQTANHGSGLDTPTNSHQTGRQTLVCFMGELDVRRWTVVLTHRSPPSLLGQTWVQRTDGHARLLSNSEDAADVLDQLMDD